MQLSLNLLFFIAFTVVDEIDDEDTKTEEQTTVTKETEDEKLLEKAEESEDSSEMEIMTEEERIHKEKSNNYLLLTPTNVAKLVFPLCASTHITESPDIFL
jgi:hypothetical protein